MQVASRLFVVWGVLYPFLGEIVGKGDLVGEFGYLGCLLAWGVTECIRYGFFVMQVNGGVETVPAWWQWLRYVNISFCFCLANGWMVGIYANKLRADRYNTFYVLYPIGICSECTLAVKGLAGAQELHPLYYWFIVAVLVVYVPGMLVLFLAFFFGLC